MTEQTDSQARITELEQQVFQLSCRVTALEAERPHMATKAEMIRSRGIFNFHFGRRKSKETDKTYWINNNLNFALALAVVVILVLTLAPLAADLLASLFAHVR